MKKGLGNITPCYYSKIKFGIFTAVRRLNNVACCSDIPVAVSLPHFYNSDPTLLDEVEGMKPIKEKHESIIVMQPVSPTFDV